MTVGTVARGTALSNTETVRVLSFDKLAKLLEPDAGQLTTFMMNFKATDQIKNPQFKWVEDEYAPRFSTLGSDLASTGATVVVTDYTFLRAGDLLKINNLEVVRVTATPTTTSVTVTRDIGGIGAQTATSGQQVFIYSDANVENSATRDLLTVQKVVNFNYAQIMRTNWALSQTAMDSDVYGGNDWQWQKGKALAEHKRKIDNVGIHGVRSESTSSSQYLHTSGGILSVVSTNIFDANGELTELSLEGYLRKGFRYGSKKRLAFCSPQPITVINSFGREKIKTDSGTSEYGITMSQYVNAGRMLKLIEHDQMTNNTNDDLTGIAGLMVVVDPEDVRLKYMGSALIVSREHIEANGTDGQQDEYRSQAGFQFVHERKHFVVKNITH